MQGNDQDSNVTELDIWPQKPTPYIGLDPKKAERYLNEKVMRVEQHAFSEAFRKEMEVFVRLWRIPHPKLAALYRDDPIRYIGEAKQIMRLAYFLDEVLGHAESIQSVMLSASGKRDKAFKYHLRVAREIECVNCYKEYVAYLEERLRTEPAPPTIECTISAVKDPDQE